MNKIYQSVEDPVTKTKRIKCDLCNNTYSHHPALRYHRLREHGKYPIARKKGQRKSKNTSNSIQIGKTTEQGKQQLLKNKATASQKHDNDLYLPTTKRDCGDSSNNTTDDDENDDEDFDILYRNPYKSRYMTSRAKRYESVVDPVTNKKRIKCDLCENTYSHHTALRNHRFKAHGKFPVARKIRKDFSSNNTNNEALIKETSEIIEYSMEDEANIKEPCESGEYNNDHFNTTIENAEFDEDNLQDPYNEEIGLASQNISSEKNELLLNHVPKIEYVEIASNSFDDEHNTEENIDIDKSLQTNDECMQTCGLIKVSMDYTILNINCFYCDYIFPLSSWEEFLTHLKEMHQNEEESFGEVEKPFLDTSESYQNRDFSFKIEIDHEALSKSANWHSNSAIDENNKTDNEEDNLLEESEYKPKDQIQKSATCDECKKTFRNALRLKIHQRRRHNVGINRRLAQRHCNICNKTFKHPSFYRKHINVHFPPKFKCDICDKEYRWQHSYNDHLKLHENQLDHVCELCGASFFCYSRLRNHTKLKHADDNAYACIICEYTCKTSMDLWLHRRSEHLVLEGTIEQLNKNPDEQPLTLEDGKDDNEEEENVKNTEELEKYSDNTNANEEPKDGNDEQILKGLQHNRNSRSKKYLTVPCNLCDKFFRDEENLQNHQYRIHQVKRFELADRHCNICNRTFKLPSMYRYHMAVHKPPSFKCQTCGKEFRWRKSLTDHMKIHANQRDHICELCGAAFFHNVRLHDHKKMWHNDEKNYSCNSCEFTCKTSTQLCQHRKKFHILEDEANQNKKKDYPSKRKPKGHRPKKYQYVVDPITNIKRLKCDLCENTYSHHPALRYHRFNEHGKLPIKTRQMPPQTETVVESSLEQEVIYMLTSEEQVVVEEQEEKIDATDYFIVYDAEEV